MEDPPETVGHESYNAMWILESGQRLRVWSPHEPDRLLLDWTVNLIPQRDQYAANARSARGLVIHSYPADLDLDAWSDLALASAPTELEVAADLPAVRHDALLRAMEFLTVLGADRDPAPALVPTSNDADYLDFAWRTMGLADRAWTFECVHDGVPRGFEHPWPDQAPCLHGCCGIGWHCPANWIEDGRI